MVDFSFVNDLVKDRYIPNFGGPADDTEFILRLYLLQYIFGDSDWQVVESGRTNPSHKYSLDLAIDEKIPDYSTPCTCRDQGLGEEKFRQQCQDRLARGEKVDNKLRPHSGSRNYQ